MELREVIRQRRSVRKYKPEPVARELLELVLEDACWAPSGENYQPWHFVALTKQEDLDSLNQVMSAAAAAMEPVLRERFAGHQEVVAETTRFIRTLGGAPVCILVFLRKVYPNRDSALAGTAAAIENLLLSACDQGLGTCWLGAPVYSGGGRWVTERFGPEEGELVGMISLGYPDHEPKAVRRKPGRWEIR